MRRARRALAVLGAVGSLALAGAPTPAPSAPTAAALTVARLQYDGDDWYANPSSLPNLIRALRERTTFAIAPEEVRLTLEDDRLWDQSFLHLTGHGRIRFSEREAARLRRFLEQGGFLHADDNYGLDEHFRREIAKVFPEHQLVDVPLDHPIYSIVYPFPQGLPKIHEHDGKPPRGLGIFLGSRLVVFYSHESDLGNGWEDVGTYPEDPPALHEAALRMGVNLFAYAVTSAGAR